MPKSFRFASRGNSPKLSRSLSAFFLLKSIALKRYVHRERKSHPRFHPLFCLSIAFSLSPLSTITDLQDKFFGSVVKSSLVLSLVNRVEPTPLLFATDSFQFVRGLSLLFIERFSQSFLIFSSRTENISRTRSINIFIPFSTAN